MTAITDTMKQLPPEALLQLQDFAEFLAGKYKKILSFAGAWKDMDETDFNSLMDDVYKRRENSFSSRWKNHHGSLSDAVIEERRSEILWT